MATKKTAKKIKKPTIVEEGSYSMVFTQDELFSAIQILSFAQVVFEQMSVNCHKEGDDKAMQIWAARAKLSLLLYGKFKDVAVIGEPTSREVH
jgi:hypothetical protein